MTICTQNRAMLFGEIVGADSISARMVLNDVMPNHFHAIIAINRADMESALLGQQ